MKDEIFIMCVCAVIGITLVMYLNLGHAMDSNFKQSLQSVLSHEGGWSDHNRGPGGSTMKGVTLTTYRTIYGQDKTKHDLKNISDEELYDIYYNRYWLKASCDELPFGIDYAVFDAAVNSGPYRAVAWLQDAAEVHVDGVIGPQTLRAVISKHPLHIIGMMIDKRLDFMQSLTIWEVFGKGWHKRVNEVRIKSIEMNYKER